MTSVAPSGSTAQTWCHWLSLKSVVPQTKPPSTSYLMEPFTGLDAWTRNVDFWPPASLPQYATTPVVEVLIHAAMVLGVDPEIPL